MVVCAASEQGIVPVIQVVQLFLNLPKFLRQAGR